MKELTDKVRRRRQLMTPERKTEIEDKLDQFVLPDREISEMWQEIYNLQEKLSIATEALESISRDDSCGSYDALTALEKIRVEK